LNLRRKKVAFALGGGAARGFAHIGVLKVLEKADVWLQVMELIRKEGCYEANASDS
jgi:predicted acylesterase/phospholipase RssA